MKTSVKVLIVGALGVAVVAAVALRKSIKPAESAGAADTQLASASGEKPIAGAPAAAKLPKLLDLGAGKCIPCKMMAPILEDLKKEYSGRLEVVFIDVWKNPKAGKQYGVEMIPTQIFYDAEGKERFRHVGFFGKEDILAKWKELGVDLGAGKAPAGTLGERK